MKDFSEMNKIVKGIYTNPFIKVNWEWFTSSINYIKNQNLKINLVIDSESRIRIPSLSRINMKEFKKAAISIQAFELVVLLKNIENDIVVNITNDVLEQCLPDEYFFASKENSRDIDLIVPYNEFINYFFNNCINFRQPDYRIIFNYIE